MLHTNPWRAFAIIFLVPLALVACASRTPEKSLNVTRVRVLPVAPIPQMYTENKGIPLGVLWQSIADSIKSDEFTRRLDQTRLAAATQMTSALVRALNSQGFEAQVLDGVARSPKDPNYIDAAKLPTTDPVLHVYFNEVGMYSSRFSTDYVPKMNVYAELIDSGSNDLGYFDYVYYGADARGAQTWSIPSDPRFRWGSFGEMVDRPSSVAEAYGAAVEAIADRLAVNLRTKVRARSLGAQMSATP